MKSINKNSPEIISIHLSSYRLFKYVLLYLLLFIISFLSFLVGMNILVDNELNNNILIVFTPFIIGLAIQGLAIRSFIIPLRSKVIFSEVGISIKKTFSTKYIKWSEIINVTIVYFYWLSEGKKNVWLGKMNFKLKNDIIYSFLLNDYTLEQKNYIKTTLKTFLKRFTNVNVSIAYEGQVKYTFVG